MADEQQTLADLKRLFPGVLVTSRMDADALAEWAAGLPAASGTLPPRRAQRDTRLINAWADFLSPNFGPTACNLTGTYSDRYGYSHGLMLARNVIKDFQAFRRSIGRSWDPACIGVEYHPSTHRAILHFHALIGGEWSDSERDLARAQWIATRGWAVAKEVTNREGCVAYAAKHLLKQGAADTFDFFLPAESYGSITQARLARKGRSQ